MPDTIDNDNMLDEYDFTHDVRGKYYERYRQGVSLPQFPAPVEDSSDVDAPEGDT